jgi:hypothetical protein
MAFSSSGSSRFSLQNIANLVLRFLQIIFALAVVGLYAQDLNKARKVGKYSDSKWVSIAFSLLHKSFILTPVIPGLRHRNWCPERHNRPRLRHPSHHHQLIHHCYPLRLGCYPLHPLGGCIRSLWEYVHQGEP